VFSALDDQTLINQLAPPTRATLPALAAAGVTTDALPEYAAACAAG
jgi:hypothetical protein